MKKKKKNQKGKPSDHISKKVMQLLKETTELGKMTPEKMEEKLESIHQQGKFATLKFEEYMQKCFDKKIMPDAAFRFFLCNYLLALVEEKEGDLKKACDEANRSFKNAMIIAVSAFKRGEGVNERTNI